MNRLFEYDLNAFKERCCYFIYWKDIMDFIFDMFSLRNVNRPYTQHEIREVYSKDHSIRDEERQSRLKKCVSFHEITDVDTEKDLQNNNENVVQS